MVLVKGQSSLPACLPHDKNLLGGMWALSLHHLQNCFSFGPGCHPHLRMQASSVARFNGYIRPTSWRMPSCVVWTLAAALVCCKTVQTTLSPHTSKRQIHSGGALHLAVAWICQSSFGVGCSLPPGGLDRASIHTTATSATSTGFCRPTLCASGGTTDRVLRAATTLCPASLYHAVAVQHTKCRDHLRRRRPWSVDSGARLGRSRR